MVSSFKIIVSFRFSPFGRFTGHKNRAMQPGLQFFFTFLNSDMRNTLKTFNYSGIMFDFNKDDYPAGLYRLGAEEYMQNSPSISLAYSVILVLKYPSQDTLAMIGFPFNSQGIIVFRQENTNNWATADWFKIEGVEI